MSSVGKAMRTNLFAHLTHLTRVIPTAAHHYHNAGYGDNEESEMNNMHERLRAESNDDQPPIHTAAKPAAADSRDDQWLL